MKSIGNKNIKTSIFRIQENNSIMCGCFCILFIIVLSFFIKVIVPLKDLESKAFPETIEIEDQSNYRLYQQSLTNKLSKYLTVFDYLNKILTVALTVFSSTNIFSHVKGMKNY